MIEAALQTHVEFRPDKFPRYEGEEHEINPDLWGRGLAEFLCEKLPSEGFKTKGSFAEDCGYRIDVVNDSFRLWIGCGHYQEYPDGYSLLHRTAQAFVRKLFGKVDTRERVESLQKALDRILVEADGIRAKRWWTHEEFNNPVR